MFQRQNQQLVLDKISEVLDATDEAYADRLTELLDAADRIFIAGVGRSKLVGNFLAMRLMHGGYDVSVGEGEPVALTIKKGYVTLDRQWKKGDTVTLNLPMPIRRVTANEKVEADRGRVAIERGPIVFCAEWPDNSGETHGLILPDHSKLTCEFHEKMLGGIEVIQGKALMASLNDENQLLGKAEHDLFLIPYYAWAHRGKGEMDVWLARGEAAIQTLLRGKQKKE